MAKVHVCNYGIGNIHNVIRAVEHIGAECINCTSPDMLKDVERLIIPGVGAFNACMDAFTAQGFHDPVMRIVDSGTKVLGICVGMQMLAEESEEFGLHKGLGLIPGRVVRIPDRAVDGTAVPVPHISWTELLPGGASWSGTPLESLPPQSHAYFVHSYAFECASRENLLATFEYGGRNHTAAVINGQLMGTQFHPEKSGEAGLSILRAFAGAET